MEKSIEEKNKAIAEFMGLIVIPSGTKTMGQIQEPEIAEAFLKYHKSWDWLMPVIEKIEKGKGVRYYFVICENDCTIYRKRNKKEDEILYGNMCPQSKIQAVFETVYQFITLTNPQQ